MNENRRDFIKKLSGSMAAGFILPGMPGILSSCSPAKESLFFKISLAQWSLNQYFNRWTPDGYTGAPGDTLEFPSLARNDYDIHAIEYVNQFFYEKAGDSKYLAELKKRCEEEGVTSVLIMVDQEGNLGDPDNEKRKEAIENHYKWAEAAAFLGCHSIRVNARSQGSWDEQMKLAAEGLRSLCEFGDKLNINVIVENHGGLSSNGEWLGGVMELVDHPRVGTLPDFGNFKLEEGKEYDRYRGVKELMPFAKGISAKTHDFDAEGNEIHTDYYRMLQIVKDAGYSGYIGIEYEGKGLSQAEGILATRALLEKAGKAVS